jgi:hypothetical protein
MSAKNPRLLTDPKKIREKETLLKQKRLKTNSDS